MKNLLKILSLLTIAGFILTSCEGPMGPEGPAGKDGTNGTNGTNGKDGKDANETCKLCHNKATVSAVAIEFNHSLHATGEAYENATRNTCAACHSHQGFLNVVTKNAPATFTGPGSTGSYTNNYIAEASVLTLPGPITCFTCHSSLHTNYAGTEFSPLTSTAAVKMTMWGAAKEINFTKTAGNLCSKCHQPRPVTASNGNVIDYSKLISEPTTTFALATLGYRSGVHYGTQGAMVAGTGAIEFGTGYANSAHVAGASCTSCHMAAPSGFGGGHSFRVLSSAEGSTSPATNFSGCNVTGCHSASPLSATSAKYKDAVLAIKTKLNALEDKINLIGVTLGGGDILQAETDGTYHGYFSIYDPSSNPTGNYKNPGSTSTWTQAQKDINAAKSAMVLTNAQFGAILNYQMVYRGGANGIHNYPYTSTLLDNTLAAI